MRAKRERPLWGWTRVNVVARAVEWKVGGRMYATMAYVRLTVCSQPPTQRQRRAQDLWCGRRHSGQLVERLHFPAWSERFLYFSCGRERSRSTKEIYIIVHSLV